MSKKFILIILINIDDIMYFVYHSWMVSTEKGPGLDGVVVADTRLSSVDGSIGELVIGGYAVEELAPRASFEETVHLLWHDRLPNAAELASLRNRLSSQRTLATGTEGLLREAAKANLPAITALRIASASLDLSSTQENPVTDLYSDAERIIAQFPVIVATYERMTSGKKPVAPRADLDHAENYLYMLTGSEPSEGRARALNTYWNTIVDHGFNASTFAARVIISTQSDLVSAVTGAVGALKGPLHGGAPGPALEMVFAIGEKEKAENFLRRKLERGERLMGFGHRIYKVRDPRAAVLSRAVERIERAPEYDTLYRLARHVEQEAIRLLEEFKPGRRLQTNVEFYTALLLHGLDFPTDLFTPTFAVGRSAGWTAHCLEQLETGRIIRPQSNYTGRRARKWVPVEERV